MTRSDTRKKLRNMKLLSKYKKQKQKNQKNQKNQKKYNIIIRKIFIFYLW